MYARLLRDYAQSGSYWRRCCFVHACGGILTVFSAKFVHVRTRELRPSIWLCPHSTLTSTLAPSYVLCLQPPTPCQATLQP